MVLMEHSATLLTCIDLRKVRNAHENRTSEMLVLVPYVESSSKHTRGPGADPGFLEREFICKKGWGFALLILSHFS